MESGVGDVRYRGRAPGEADERVGGRMELSQGEGPRGSEPWKRSGDARLPLLAAFNVGLRLDLVEDAELLARDRRGA